MKTPSDTALLLAELDAEFGRKPKVKSPPSDSDIRKALNKGLHESIDGARNPLTGANSIARSWRDDPGFQPVRRIIYTHLELCKSCGHCVEYVANVFTEYSNPKLKASVKSAETVTHDSLGFELPLVIETHSLEVEECVSCLRLQQSCSHLIDEALAPQPAEPLQFDIFGGSHARH